MNFPLLTKGGYTVISVRWGNPYTQPPEGWPQVLWGICLPWPCDAQFRRELEQRFPLAPSGYCLCGSHNTVEPPCVLSGERKAALRLNRLQKRMEEKHPLFAEQFIRESIEERPDYFDAAAIERENIRIRQRRQAWIDETLESWEECGGLTLGRDNLSLQFKAAPSAARGDDHAVE